MTKNRSDNSRSAINKLVLGATGIVYGDIGTSPLYTLRECLVEHQSQPQEAGILGILSLIFWSILIVVCFKYAILVLRADNNGEGGILALTAFMRREKIFKNSTGLMFLGIFGASLFCGDALITPAISVLGALEGLVVASPHLQSLIIPFAIFILIVLFIAQSQGTTTIGAYFGPVMTVWFLTIGILGLAQIIQNPFILKAMNPYYSVHLIMTHGPSSLLVLGTTVLALTGVEAMYADLGHFGRTPIQRAWFYLVFPCLILNYFGQGALLLNHPEAIENPFYHLAPSWALYPLIVLALIATVIASQAVISGVFSIGWQALQLGFAPRMRILHTSAKHIGQVYIPVLNLLLAIATILLVLIFKNSASLAVAYGLVVSAIMLMTSVLIMFVAKHLWGWKSWQVYLVFGFLITVDTLYFAMNLAKFIHGGWLPLLIALTIFYVMRVWYQERLVLKKHIKKSVMDINQFLGIIDKKNLTKREGTAIYMAPFTDSIPEALKLNVLHYKILHEKTILLTCSVNDIPKVSAKQRLSIEEPREGVYLINAQYGFKETPNIHNIFTKINELGIASSLETTTFFVSRVFPVMSSKRLLGGWRERIFILLSRNAMNPTEFFHIPNDRVIEVTTRVKI